MSGGDRIVAGVDDVTFMKFVLDNNDSGDVNVTSVSVLGIGQGQAASTFNNFTGAIFVDGVQQGSSKNLSTTGTATFNDLNVLISSSLQKEFEVVFDTIENSATTANVSTTLAAGAGTENVVGAVANVAAAGAGTGGTASAGGTTIAVAGTGTLVALAAGDQIVISTDGSATIGGAEVRTVAAAAAVGSASITVTAAFSVGHTAEAISLVTTQYPATASSITVANAGSLSVGSLIRITGATGGVANQVVNGVTTAVTDFVVRTISGT